MADKEQVSMTREVFRGLDRAVEAVVSGIGLPARLCRYLVRKFGGRRLGWILASVGATALVLGLAVWLYRPEYLDFDFWWGKESERHSEVFRNFGLLLVAVVGFGFAAWRTMIAQEGVRTARQQAALVERGQITDRYAKAVEMLSDDNARTRTGAVYALGRIARDSIERDHIPVMEVLSEFIRRPPYGDEAARRNRARALEADRHKDPSEVPPPIQCPDIHAALRVIAANALLASTPSLGTKTVLPKSRHPRVPCLLLVLRICSLASLQARAGIGRAGG